MIKHLPKGIRHIAYALRVWRTARGADAVFAEDTVSAGLPALWAARAARRPCIVRVPGEHAWEQGRQRFGVVDTLDEFQTKRYSWRVELLRFLGRYTVRHADRVVVPSHYFERIVSGWGVDASRLGVIYNGIEAVPPELPAEPPTRPFVVSVGRLVPWKGFLALIDVLPQLPEWQLVIVGDGPQRAMLEAAAETRGVHDRVHFTGSVSRPQVLGWLSAADAFVLNSSFESFSYQVVEALAMGTPVIATRIGSIPELVNEGSEGVLVEPNDRTALVRSIESVKKQPEAWAVRADAGRRKAEQFSAKATAEQTADLVRSLVV
ncbi:MAG TPA: glycosyltransferase family 4 protein [Candidatus Paceibacterota bacterium]|nr:glycosyltransferase family 4 protein [Candidatus Paceibacterota bacterium]